MEFIQKNKQFNLIGIIFAIVFAISVSISFFLITSAKKAEDAIKQNEKQNNINKQDEQKVTLSFVGDLLMHSAQRKSGYDAEKNTYNFDYFFKDIKPYWKNRDFVIGSFESPVIQGIKDSDYSGYPFFKNPPEFLKAIKDAGIKTLVTANNHTMDLGAGSAATTMDFIESYGIKYTGTYKTKEQRDANPVLFLEKNNIKIAVLNYTQLTNAAYPNDKAYMLNIIDPSHVKKDISFAKQSGADEVIVWFHFGTEYQRHPDGYQKSVVQETAKAGADIIIGSHPHVIQPFEVIDVNGRKVFVAYAIGNFISNQYWRYSTDGMVLNIDLEKKDGKTIFSNINYIPTSVIREYNGPEIQKEKVVKQNDKDYDFITGAISKGILKGPELKFRVVPVGQAIYDYENKLDNKLSERDYERLKTTWNDTTGLVGESEYYKVYRDERIMDMPIGQER